jgi:1,2-diacylglycerol 3-alpha-glucosyltransferase
MTDKPKLLIISDSFLPRWDGVARFLDLLIPKLTKDFELTVIAPKFRGNPPEYKDVKIVLLETYNFQIADYTPPKTQRKLIFNHIKQNDIIFCQTLGLIGTLAINKAKKLNKKVLLYTHSIEWELFSSGLTRIHLFNKFITSVTKSFVLDKYNKCSKIVVPFKTFETKLKNLKIKTPISIVKLGINRKRFKPSKTKEKAKEKLGFNPEKLIIGYVGRIGKEKDLPTLYKAFTKLNEKYPNILLMIIGQGNETEEAKLKGENIVLMGKIDNVIPYLQAFDIYVLPSITETSSLSTMEAMACENCVVTTPVGMIPKYIKNEKNGFLFPKQDDKKLYEILEKLIENKALREKCAKNAKKTISKDYNWKDTEKNIIKLLKEEIPSNKN